MELVNKVLEKNHCGFRAKLVEARKLEAENIIENIYQLYGTRNLVHYYESDMKRVFDFQRLIFKNGEAQSESIRVYCYNDGRHHLTKGYGPVDFEFDYTRKYREF